MENKSFKGQREIKIINPANFAKSYTDYLSGKTTFAEISSNDFLIPQFETEPLDGFELPESFPD